MKYIAILLLMLCLQSVAFSQNPTDAKTLIEDGIAYHDKGDYEGALNKYNLALQLDKDNLLALHEKAYTLYTIKKYEEAIECCSTAISVHPRERRVAQVYVMLGNIYDDMKKTDKSIETYNEAIKMFPNEYLLHFNKGITLISIRKYDEAIACFKNALLINPDHPGSHNGLALSLENKNKRIPALLARCRFLSLEPKGERAKANLKSLENLITVKTSEKEDGGKALFLNAGIFGDTTADGKSNEYDFSHIEMMMDIKGFMQVAKIKVTDSSSSNKDSVKKPIDEDKLKAEVAKMFGVGADSTKVSKFIDIFTMVCTSLNESDQEKTDDKRKRVGFYWKYYAPYFVEMKEKNHIKTFAYIAHISTEEPYVLEWIKANKTAINDFLKWSQNYKWASL
jgi:tetratricopeptide (TPR) repeat protein